MSFELDRRVFLGSALALGAACAVNPPCALGVTSVEKKAEVQAVKAKLDAMQDEVDDAGEKYAQASYEYKQACAKAAECEQSIGSAQDKISTLQGHLETRATSMYRSGSMSYLDVLLGVGSFDDFATVWDTLNSLNAEDADLVAQTKIAKAELESAKRELDDQQARASEQLAHARAYKQQVESKQAQYDDAYSSLSSEYHRLLAAEEQAANERARQVAAAHAKSSASSKKTGGSGSSTSGSSKSGSKGSSGGSIGTASTPAKGGVVDYALSRVGCRYVWGAAGPSSFDCSGLVVWAYKKAYGMSLPHYSEGLYAQAKARLSPSAAQPGDVLYKYGHVGISLGGTSAVEALNAASGVVTTDRGGVWTAALRF